MPEQFLPMARDTRDASTITGERTVRPDHAAINTLIVKCVFMITLFAAIGGWLWLLGKGAVAIARLL
jgi:hypothetical protein